MYLSDRNMLPHSRYNILATSCGSILILLASCQQTCMTYSIAVCILENSWWWTKEMSETCRVSFQK